MSYDEVQKVGAVKVEECFAVPTRVGIIFA